MFKNEDRRTIELSDIYDDRQEVSKNVSGEVDQLRNAESFNLRFLSNPKAFSVYS